jgi:hydroxymethylglutaryl-CoA lyase
MGPRDGLQSLHKQISLNDKLDLIRALAVAGIPAAELISFVSPMAVPQMADADMFCPVFPVKGGAQYSALVPDASGAERTNAARSTLTMQGN